MTLALSIPAIDQSFRPVHEMIARIIGPRAREFETQLLPDAGDEYFEISGGGSDPVLLRANSPSALTRAFSHYLKCVCNSHVSWCGNRIDLPTPLPRIESTLRVTTPFAYRFYFNYCTFSYSMAFWDWPRWEKEIDWMALAGINLPLAITGQEAVWRQVYGKLGLSDSDLKEFFAGPAFLAWGWMGNLDGWGGPTTDAWIDQQCELQKKILARERELGMKPVLPAFTGHVPAALSKRFPDSGIKQLHNWAENFPGTHVLDPMDPLFQQIGHSFIEEQTKLYGTDTWGTEHFYSCDTFNENSPPSDAPEYLSAVSKSLYQGMAGADDRAVWVMQAWMFFFNPDSPDFWKMPQIHALLDAVPSDRMLVLDLHSEGQPLWRKTENFCGKQWVWCFLHNFGGHRSMFGNFDRLADDVPAALADESRGHLVGMGLTPEGIETNPVLYDLATDLMWRKTPVDKSQWLADYALRRYGKSSAAADQAWNILRKTVYSRPPDLSGTVCTMLNLSPRLVADRAIISYKAQDLIPAWELLVAAAPRFKSVDPFQYDLLDVARQVLANFATEIHASISAAYYRKDIAALQKHGAAFLELIDDVDQLLSTRREFMLGPWLESAKAASVNDEDRRMREWNARTQITLWGNPQSMLRDYARKEWAGLLTDFYRYRWDAFFKELARCLSGNLRYEEKPFQQKLRAWEAAWANRTNLFPHDPVGSTIEVATALFAKYRPILLERYTPAISLINGKQASASDGTQPAHPAQAGITGIASRSSFWSASPLPQWLMVDLEAQTAISSVQIFFYWDGSRSYRYSIELSRDGTTWQKVADASENDSPATADGDHHRFSTETARYIRVIVIANSANEAGHILDLRAYA